MTVDTDKVVAAYTGYVTDMQAFGREPYQFELDLIAAIEQSQFDRDTYRDEAKGWLGRCDKIEAEYATLKAEYEQSQKELAFELETQTKQAKKLQALNGVQHMNGVLQKRVAELEGLLKESYQALIDHCSWLGEDALPPRINKALSPKDGD